MTGDMLKVYQILVTKFSHEEAITIIDYIESMRTLPADNTEIIKLRGDMDLKLIKLDGKIKIGLILVMGITVILLRVMWVALTK
ncbi:MAG: hypothetical protein A4E57_04302 [Syntrophorhabdaceae bacterium PtaU1.Bin034]|jgi:hypothetical protein|nr:MAG: hypothetical protein A4E57_04302 [Syntrophorhabdaceae bacterium PtaU1.Bin034]